MRERFQKDQTRFYWSNCSKKRLTHVIRQNRPVASVWINIWSKKWYRIVIRWGRTQFTFTIFQRFLTTHLPKFLQFHNIIVYNFSRVLTIHPPRIVNVNFEYPYANFRSQICTFNEKIRFLLGGYQNYQCHHQQFRKIAPLF